MLESLLLLTLFLVDDPATRQPVATRVESIAYPDFARAAQIQGAVDVEIVIGSDGGISSANAISGHPALKKLPRKT